MKKRSIGVTIIAWLIIIGSIVTLKNIFDSSYKDVNPILSYYFYLIICPFSVIAAIYLLKLKNWARITIIVISLLVAIESTATYSYYRSSLKQNGDKIYDKMVEKQSKQITRYDNKIIDENRETIKSHKVREDFKNFAIVFMTFLILIGLCFNFIVIYFFTRPKIKEQFK